MDLKPIVQQISKLIILQSHKNGRGNGPHFRHIAQNNLGKNALKNAFIFDTLLYLKKA